MTYSEYGSAGKVYCYNEKGEIIDAIADLNRREQERRQRDLLEEFHKLTDELGI
jgi:hypothetical protein